MGIAQNIYLVLDEEIKSIFTFVQIDVALLNANSNCQLEDWKVSKDNWQEKLLEVITEKYTTVIVPLDWINEKSFELNSKLYSLVIDGKLKIASFDLSVMTLPPNFIIYIIFHI